MSEPTFLKKELETRSAFTVAYPGVLGVYVCGGMRQPFNLQENKKMHPFQSNFLYLPL